MSFTIQDFFNTGFVGKYFWSNPQDQNALIWFIISAAAIIVAAYLLGSINFAIIISGRTYKQDIRNFGSKNAGMTNMMRTYGKKAAGLTLGGDAFKAILSCLIGYTLLGQLGAYIAGLFCICGHVFPVFYGFKGGKGVVTAAATILMCDPIIFVILLAMFVIIVAFTKFISLGSVMCMLLYPIVLDRITQLLWGHPNEYQLFAVSMAILVIAKHHENISRLLRGEERKFSFKKSKKPTTEEVTDTKEKEDAQA